MQGNRKQEDNLPRLPKQLSPIQLVSSPFFNSLARVDSARVEMKQHEILMKNKVTFK